MALRPYRILSLDGGGIRGLLSIVLMERLENDTPGFLGKVDLFAGTSTGGILALALAGGTPLSLLRQFYEGAGQAIFGDSLADNVKDLGSATGAQYSNHGLRRAIRQLFGDKKLMDLKGRVLIPAFDLDNNSQDPRSRSWAPKFFHNFPGEDSDGEEFCAHVALATSAAPTYFPSWEGFIDGGVVAANPSMAALAQTQDARSFPKRPALSRLRLLSLGTGVSLKSIEGREHDWGKLQWVSPLIEIMFSGVSGVADFQCRQILGDHYHRLNPVFRPGDEIPLDAVGRTADIIKAAEATDLKATHEWLDREWGLS
ncbi:MAG: patatin-like phospholipase family protein [Planctomycetota bacterium]